MKLGRFEFASAAALARIAPAIAAGDRSAQAGSAREARAAPARHDAPTIRSVLQALQDKGFDIGPIDGIIGPRTRAALREFQERQGMPATGRLDAETLSRLNVPGARSGG